MSIKTEERQAQILTQAEKFMADVDVIFKTRDDAEKADEDFDFFEAFDNLKNTMWWELTERYQPAGSGDDYFDDKDGGLLYVFPDGSGLEGPFIQDSDYEVLSAEEVVARKMGLDDEFAAALAEPLLAQSVGLGSI